MLWIIFCPTLRKHLGDSDKDHVAINGRRLHPSLITFLEKSTQTRHDKIIASILGISPNQPCNIVFITNEEEELYQRKMAKAELKVQKFGHW